MIKKSPRKKSSLRATTGRNFREVGTLSPKVLLNNLTDIDGNILRDHCWVELTDDLLKLLPTKSNKIKVTIEFEAVIITYGNDKLGLKKLSNIRKLTKSSNSTTNRNDSTFV